MRQEVGCSPILSQTLGTVYCILDPDDYQAKGTSEEEEEDDEEEEDKYENEEESVEEEEK